MTPLVTALISILAEAVRQLRAEGHQPDAIDQIWSQAKSAADLDEYYPPEA